MFGGLSVSDDDRIDSRGSGGRKRGGARTQTRKPARQSKRGGRGGGNGGGRRGDRRRSPWRWVGRLFYAGVVLGVWGVIAIAGILAYYAFHLPPPSELAVPDRPANIKVVSFDGRLIGNRGETGGEAVRLFELPDYVPKAVMAIEDRRFYSHPGIDPIGLARAMFVNFRAGGVVQGGSTLTQQLAKNLFLEPSRTIERKIQEVVLALWLESEYDKDAILEMYLNRVYLGAGAYGIEAAARRYYGKSSRELTLAEAATIAGLLKAPSRFAPTNNPERAEARARTVLNAMVEAGFINAGQAELAENNPAQVTPASLGGSEGYVADYVAAEVEALIGKVESDVVVETTIDLTLQAEAEAALLGVLAENGAERKAGQAALVTMDPNGAVRALVGGRSYSESQFNRATTAQRQPGSAFKTFVYLAAMDYGLTPDTVRVDQPVQYGNWSPENYDNKYRGPMTLSEALFKSINTVAVQLTNELSVDYVVAMAQKLGIRSELQHNMSIALGTSEVTLLEMTGAYAPLANGGFAAHPYVIDRIRTEEGDILYERTGSGVGRIVSDQVVGAMNHMLGKVVESGTATRAAFGGWPAAGKTGTAQEFRDAWFVGYTARYVTGVWVGNDDRAPMQKVGGGTLPAMIWHDFMEAAHQDMQVLALPGDYQPTGPMVASGQPHWTTENSAYADQGRYYDPATGRYEPIDPNAQRPPVPAADDGGLPLGGFFQRIFGG